MGQRAGQIEIAGLFLSDDMSVGLWLSCEASLAIRPVPKQCARIAAAPVASKALIELRSAYAPGLAVKHSHALVNDIQRSTARSEGDSLEFVLCMPGRLARNWQELVEEDAGCRTTYATTHVEGREEEEAGMQQRGSRRGPSSRSHKHCRRDSHVVNQPGSTF